MDIEKPAQRKTVQWNTQQFDAILLNQNNNFRKKVLNFESKKMEQDDQNKSSDDSSSSQEKSQKTIEIQINLKKAKINRVSQQMGKSISLKQLNRKISVKQNIFIEQEQCIDENTLQKQNEFQRKRSARCNQSFPVKKKN